MSVARLKQLLVGLAILATIVVGVAWLLVATAPRLHIFWADQAPAHLYEMTAAIPVRIVVGLLTPVLIALGVVLLNVPSGEERPRPPSTLRPDTLGPPERSQMP